MRAGAQTNDRLAGIDVVDEVLHLRLGQIAEPEQHDAQVRRVERLHAGNVVDGDRIDQAIGRIDGKEDRAFEAMPDREDLGQHRQGLLGTILFIPGQEHDVFALPRASLALVNDAVGSDCGTYGTRDPQQTQNDQPVDVFHIE